MTYCVRCVYPARTANLLLDDEGICSACRIAEELATLTPQFWAARAAKFAEMMAKARSTDGSRHDCIVAVSGGKDSYFQTHVIKQLHGLNPLLVTYHGNNYLPEGQGNLERMRDVLDCDHLMFGPSVDTLRKLNLAGFRKMGDMNWHCHAGIKIVPMTVAVRYRIPIVIWGEITWSVAGMFSPDDYVEYNKRTVFEHDLRGFTWKDMLGAEGLKARDLAWLRFPSDEDIASIGVRGLYIGNFYPWNPNEHTHLVQEKYAFESARQPFERTYRMMSNLDDMHENGIHDYMKFVKFGYGRASDHSSKDVRSGHMTREQAVEMVRMYDHVKPRRDLERWLDYVGMSESEFDETADTFRDPRVWWIHNGLWWKHNIWGEPSAYGPVYLRDPERVRLFEAKAARLAAGSD